MSRIFLTALIALGSLVRADATFAQIISGSVVGTVKDQTGAFLPGVTLVVTNEQTQEIHTTVASREGNYAVPLLKPGVYSVTAELSGFRKETKSSVRVQIDQKAEVDFVLGVGDVAETIQVQAQVPLVEKHSSDIGKIVTEEQAVALPLNGRNFIQLALLTTGAITGAQGGFSNQFAIAGIAPSIQGGRSDQNNILLDGITINDKQWNIPAYTPSIDAIREFKVQAGLYSAESGFAGASEINVALKSGSATFHGSGFEFLRNEHLDARNFFDAHDRDIPPYRQNQFGGSLGGPVVKGRTFFFSNVEWLRIRKTITATASVPTTALRSGDFSGLAPIYNPFTYDPVTKTRQPFRNNKIPTELINPAARALLDLIQSPNLPGLSRNLLTTGQRSIDSNQVNTRIDHTFGSKDGLFAHFTRSQISKTEPFTGNFQSAAPFPPAGFPQDNQLKAITATTVWTHTFNPHVINEARFGYTFTNGFQTSGIKRDFAAQNGITGTTADPLLIGVPRISIVGFSDVGDSPTDLRWRNHDYSIVDNLTYARGSHTFKTGGTITRVRSMPNFAVQPRGQFQFRSAIFTNDPQRPDTTGSTFADFLLGLPTNALSGVGDNTLDGRGWEFAVFAQDDWIVSSKLTLNMGLRYELRPPLQEENGRLANFDFRIPALVIATQDGTINPRAADASTRFPTLPMVTNVQAGLPSALATTDFENLAPRVGFAYALNTETVLRAGYGIFYDTGHRGFFATKAFNPPFFNFQSADNSQNLVAPLTIQNIFASRTSVIPSIQPNPIVFPASQLQEWSVNVQRQLTEKTRVEVYYLGSRGKNLLIQTAPNQPTPGPGAIAPRAPVPFVATNLSAIQPLGRSWYDSLNVRLDRRLGTGFSYGAVYTWAQNLDQGSRQDSTAATPRGPQNQHNLLAEKGRADVDFRHRLVVNTIYAPPLSHRPGVIGHILEGWTITGILTLQGNTPLTPTLGQDRSNTGVFNDRPDVIGDPNTGPRDPSNWFNSAALALPARFTFGTAGRNILEGPSYRDLDMSLLKDFSLSGASRAQFRVEVFNVTNTPHFDLPNAQFDSLSFGKVFTAQDARIVQLGLKILW